MAKRPITLAEKTIAMLSTVDAAFLARLCEEYARDTLGAGATQDSISARAEEKWNEIGQDPTATVNEVMEKMASEGMNRETITEWIMDTAEHYPDFH